MKLREEFKSGVRNMVVYGDFHAGVPAPAFKEGKAEFKVDLKGVSIKHDDIADALGLHFDRNREIFEKMEECMEINNEAEKIFEALKDKMRSEIIDWVSVITKEVVAEASKVIKDEIKNSFQKELDRL